MYRDVGVGAYASQIDILIVARTGDLTEKCHMLYRRAVQFLHVCGL